MLERRAFGELPEKHHRALRSAEGALRYEECLTREGFEGPYTILYHQHRPQALIALATAPIDVAPRASTAPRLGLRRRHLASGRVQRGGSPTGEQVALLYNADLTLSVAKPSESDSGYAVNADGDELLFIREGRGILRSPLGDLPYAPLDYLFVPKGLVHRFALEGDAPHDYLRIECRRGLDLPRQFRNAAGQLRMDAPYCHRDFRIPTFTGPVDEELRSVTIKRDGRRYAYRSAASPLDVVGWDGSVYPWTMPILAFQPRVSSVHLPPTVHGTFAAGGALVCSFVPRPLDFGPDAVPCPYPHSSVDIDEVLYYVSGNFTSRSGVGPGSLTLHPRGVPHGPQPGRYEASIGTTHTSELAVMLDCARPLAPTDAALEIDDPAYEASFG